jgi:hypothetical protein
VTLPLPVRNRLAELILDAFRDSGARAVVETLCIFCEGRALIHRTLPPGFPVEFFDQRRGQLVLKGAYHRFRDEFCERVGRARVVVKGWPLSGHEPSLRQALDQAAALFDARLDFEVHELLEPFWMSARGITKEALRGLIQVAVGYHHLANGNVPGARSLLEEGSAKLLERHLEGLNLDAFATAVRRTLETINRLGGKASEKFHWSLVPRFPRGS